MQIRPGVHFACPDANGNICLYRLDGQCQLDRVSTLPIIAASYGCVYPFIHRGNLYMAHTADMFISIYKIAADNCVECIGLYDGHKSLVKNGPLIPASHRYPYGKPDRFINIDSRDRLCFMSRDKYVWIGIDGDNVSIDGPRDYCLFRSPKFLNVGHDDAGFCNWSPSIYDSIRDIHYWISYEIDDAVKVYTSEIVKITDNLARLRICQPRRQVTSVSSIIKCKYVSACVAGSQVIVFSARYLLYMLVNIDTMKRIYLNASSTISIYIVIVGDSVRMAIHIHRTINGERQLRMSCKSAIDGTCYSVQIDTDSCINNINFYIPCMFYYSG
jgi:hypothetical protein